MTKRLVEPLLAHSRPTAAAILNASACDLANALTDTSVLSPTSPSIRFRVKLLRVMDGDTLRVLWHGEDCAVCLVGINTPEHGQPGFHESTAALVTLLADAEVVDLTFPDNRIRRDSFGRLLATVWRDTLDCNTAMLDNGHAQPYTRRRRER